MKEASYFCGFVAIIGRPNVGKSTLLNHLLGKKISITSRKAQTTRHRILGIKTSGNVQTIFIDTPGMHRITPHALNKYMNKVAVQAIKSVDIILFLTEGTRFTEEDEWICQAVMKAHVPVLWVINKIDKLSDKEILLPHIERMKAHYSFAQIIPMSARREKECERLLQMIQTFLPESTELLYPSTEVTDQSESFIVSERLREALLRANGDEIPHQLTVVTEKIEHKPHIIVIHVLIYVEREGHKAIIIGKDGERLRAVGTQARKALESYFQKKVYLQIWVKIRPWLNDPKALKQLGYTD